jgi:hypothetical protein
LHFRHIPEQRIDMAPTLLELPRELLALIVQRTLLNDAAIINTCKVNRQPSSSRTRDNHFMERTRPRSSNSLTMVNRLLHEIFEAEAPKMATYKFTIIEWMLDDISQWEKIVALDDVRYVRFDVMLMVHNEQDVKNRDTITRAIHEFKNARDIEVIFQGERDDQAVGLNGHALLFDFGRTLRSMQKLQAYRIVYIRRDHRSMMDDVSEYAVTRLSATSWKTFTRLTCPGVQQMRPYAIEFNMQIGSRMAGHGNNRF